jgi:hypothetical protein
VGTFIDVSVEDFEFNLEDFFPDWPEGFPLPEIEFPDTDLTENLEDAESTIDIVSLNGNTLVLQSNIEETTNEDGSTSTTMVVQNMTLEKQ